MSDQLKLQARNCLTNFCAYPRTVATKLVERMQAGEIEKIVQAGSPAEEVLEVGDVILGVDGRVGVGRPERDAQPLVDQAGAEDLGMAAVEGERRVVVQLLRQGDAEAAEIPLATDPGESEEAADGLRRIARGRLRRLDRPLFQRSLGLEVLHAGLEPPFHEPRLLRRARLLEEQEVATLITVERLHG